MRAPHLWEAVARAIQFGLYKQHFQISNLSIFFPTFYKYILKVLICRPLYHFYTIYLSSHFYHFFYKILTLYLHDIILIKKIKINNQLTQFYSSQAISEGLVELSIGGQLMKWLYTRSIVALNHEIISFLFVGVFLLGYCSLYFTL